jgi:hypothetical protein
LVASRLVPRRAGTAQGRRARPRAGDEIIGTAVVRQRKAYPVYDWEYKEHLAALLAARNILGEKLDVWAVNTEDEYHEITTT